MFRRSGENFARSAAPPCLTAMNGNLTLRALGEMCETDVEQGASLT
jgi:hypothetical protein